MKKWIKLRVNGKEQEVHVDPQTPLLYVLRNQLALNGPKFGCGLSQCGACMVLFDGEANPSCLIAVERAAKMEITTLEGLADENGNLHRVQQAFIDEQAAQCGFCLNGLVMASVGLLNKKSGSIRRRYSGRIIQEYLSLWSTCEGCSCHKKSFQSINSFHDIYPA